MPNNVPVGTVIASLMTYAELCACDSRYRAAWVPADGRDVTQSEYGRVKASSTTTPILAPDLRGVFLRGLNNVDDNLAPRADGYEDPEGARTPGALQSDGLQDHTHLYFQAAVTAQYTPHGNLFNGIAKNQSGDAASKGADLDNSNRKVPGEIGIETRPKNAAVFYYLKINDLP